MHKTFKTIIILSILAFTLMSCSARVNNSVVGQSFPYAKFIMLDGTERMLSEWKGKPVVIMFWSAGCPSCERAIDRLNESGWALRRNSDTVFIAASVDSMSDLAAVQARSKQPDMKWFLHAFSGNDMADESFQRFNGSGTPFFVLVSRNGKVLYTGSSVDSVLEFVKKQAAYSQPTFGRF